MHSLTKLILKDMKPALGVTEPGAIAFATAKAKSFTHGFVEKVELILNSGMYKNAFTCGIPNSTHVGNLYAAALGVIAGDHEKGLESLSNVTEADNAAAIKMVEDDKITVKLSEISPDIFIQAVVKTATDSAEVTIRDSHTNITQIIVNGETVFEKPLEKKSEEYLVTNEIHQYTLKDLVEYAKTIDIDEISFVKEAYLVNLALFEEGLGSTQTTFIHQLLDMNDNQVISKNELKTAQLLCNGAIEARVLGLSKPAMSITGSGAHGIICTMPLYAVYKIRGLSEDMLLRATVLSYLITIYIKEYSGRLSAFCGCAIAAGTGMACALLFLMDGTLQQMSQCINNMASSITGMICDGGNQGCTMKGIVAVDAAFKSLELAMGNAYIYSIHGINGRTPEETMKNMGLIASPGMIATEKTIIDIMERKLP